MVSQVQVAKLENTQTVKLAGQSLNWQLYSRRLKEPRFDEAGPYSGY